jgi:hypothetical protein
MIEGVQGTEANKPLPYTLNIIYGQPKNLDF